MNRNARTTVKRIITVCVVVVIVGYALFNARLLLLGPKIEMVTPANGTTVASPFVTLSGQTYNISEIWLNDRTIFITENGTFKENLVLAKGINTFEIRGHDKFDRPIEEVVQYVYTGKEM